MAIKDLLVAFNDDRGAHTGKVRSRKAVQTGFHLPTTLGRDCGSDLDVGQSG